MDNLAVSQLWSHIPIGAEIGEYKVINFGSTDRAHCDPHDAGLTLILVITDHPAHHLVLPEIGKYVLLSTFSLSELQLTSSFKGLKLKIDNGTMIAIASAYLVHFVHGIQQAMGRYSLVSITQRATANHYAGGIFPPLV
jgi:hypothetical protein